MADGYAVRMTPGQGSRRVGEVLSAGDLIIDVVQADEDVLFAVDDVIESCEMRIQAAKHRGVKAEAAGIQAVADGRIVDGVLGGRDGESGKGGRIDASVGIDLLVLSKVQGRKCRGGAVKIDTILVVQDAFAQAGSRY